MSGRAGCSGEWDVELREANGGERTVQADAVWMATGNRLDAAALPLLRTVRAIAPQPEYGGLPQLTPSLRWEERTPLYVAGGLSALQVGPDALTLGGAGLGAARIVSDILSEPAG